MSDFAIALHSVITPWTVAVVCLILLGISVYYCAVEKKARDRADREREAADEARVREQVRQIVAAELGRSRQAASPANRREPAEWFFPGDGAA